MTDRRTESMRAAIDDMRAAIDDCANALAVALLLAQKLAASNGGGAAHTALLEAVERAARALAALQPQQRETP